MHNIFTMEYIWKWIFVAVLIVTIIIVTYNDKHK